MDSLYLNKNLLLDSTSSLDVSDYVILGIPFDSTSTHRPGSRFAPLEVRKEFLELEKEFDDKSLFEVKYCDIGNIEVVPGNAGETLKRVEGVVKEVREVNSDAIILSIGGEHLMSLGVVKGIDVPGLEFLSLDAHLDLKDDYLGETLSHSTVLRRISELDTRISVIGARSMDNNEVAYARSESVGFWGVEGFDEALSEVKGKKVYLSIDFDVLDPLDAPGVGNPEPHGLRFNNLESVIEYVKLNCSVVGFDFMEVSPPFDTRATAVYAAKSLIKAMV